MLAEHGRRGQAGPWIDAAKAIMTTDTYPKVATATVELDGADGDDHRHRQGLGHDRARHGDDAVLRLHRRADRGAGAAGAAVSAAIDKSFNAVTVDSDTSTSDTLLVFATGKAARRGAPRSPTPSDPRARRVSRGRSAMCCTISRMQVVRDGEGATKLVEVTVEGADSDALGLRIALSIANSPLVKTAIAGEDANWGRVVMAVGKAGEPADRDRLSIGFGDIRVATRASARRPIAKPRLGLHEAARRSRIRVDLGLGTRQGDGLHLRPDHGILDINGDYRS